MSEFNGVENAEKVTAILGRWPSFHDAEVLSLIYSRTDSGFDIQAKVHTWESTGEVDEKGFYRLQNHIVVNFHFVDCVWPETDLREFGTQNVLFGLKTIEEGAHRITHFEPCYGLYGTVCSRRVVVLDVQEYDSRARAEERESSLSE